MQNGKKTSSKTNIEFNVMKPDPEKGKREALPQKTGMNSVKSGFNLDSDNTVKE
jgi:hypothetical protein